MDLQTNSIVIAAFYCFYPVADLIELQNQLTQIAVDEELKGTILIASEGINSTIAGSRQAIDELKKFLFMDLKLIDKIEYKESFASSYPFKKLKIKIKDEIVTFGEKLNDPKLAGKYLTAAEWDQMLTEEDIVVIDTRNNYEYEVGTFKNALNPNTDIFSDLKPWTEQNIDSFKDKKVMMFCTGGIRCEKSTAYYKKLGIENVYHLKGGILQYLEDTNNKNNFWQGECFVFDDRFAVDDDLYLTSLKSNSSIENNN